MLDLSLAVIAAAFAQLVIGAFAVSWLLGHLSRLGTRQDDAGTGIPYAAGAVPLLGHALLYKADAPGFLCEQSARLGAVFRVNLAGKRMIVLGPHRQAVALVVNASESLLSARQAIASLGFNEVLGEYNVLHGPDFHKRVLKEWLSPAKMGDALKPLVAALTAAFSLEISRSIRGTGQIADLFVLVRRCVLRAMLDQTMGKALLETAGEGLLDQVMHFQDALEEAIASSSVLPRAIALPLALWPVARLRAKLRATIARPLRAMLEKGERHRAPWLAAFRAEQLPVETCAELVIGLMFAAHKNPAIGSAQAFICLLEHGGEELRLAREEAALLLGSPSAPTLDGCVALRRCVLESTRICAHSLGAVRTVVHPEGLALELAPGKLVRAKLGETIALSHIAPNLDPSAWGANARSYEPCRGEWLAATSSGTSFFAKGPLVDDYKYTTFSQGMHKCPGERLSLALMQAAVACLLAGPHHLELVRPVPALSFVRATLAQRAAPVRLNVTASARTPSSGKTVTVAA